MKKFISLMLVVIMTLLIMVTPALATESEYVEEYPDEQIITCEYCEDDYYCEECQQDYLEVYLEDSYLDYMVLHVHGRPSAPISRMFADGNSYVNLREAADALSATVEWDSENQIVHWTPGDSSFVTAISFGAVGGFNDNGTIWVPEDFIWDVYFMTTGWHFGRSVVRDDIPYAAPVVRTTDHGQMAVDFIEVMNDTLYNRVPFSYRELEAAQWIQAQLIEMGYDEDAVILQTFTIEDAAALQGMFGFGSLWIYEQFNAFDQNQRLTYDEAIESAIQDMIEQQNEMIAMIADDMNISFEEARTMVAEDFGMFVDLFDKFIETAARDAAPFQLNMGEVFGLFDTDMRFRPKSQNVILTIPGQSERKIVVTAHYDSIMVPGASDNASGTALLLESAYRMLEVDNYFTIVYVFMGAEEIGLHGAYYYVDSLSAAGRNNIVLNINADVLFEGPYFFFGAGVFDQEWWGLTDNEVTLLIAEIAEELNASYGTALINAPSLAQMPSDQLAFLHGNHTVVTLVGLARLGAEGYEDFPTWDMYPGFGSSIVHTEFDCIHFINETWPNKIGDAMWTFSLMLEYLLVAEFDYTNLQEVNVVAQDIPRDADLSDHPLIGTWVWDENEDWTFVFNEDGTGTRGLPDEMVEFTWYADDFNLYIQMDDADMSEFWQFFGMEDDMLVLGLHWFHFSYTRQ